MGQQQGITDINEYRRARRKAGAWRGVLMMVLLLVCLVAGYFFAISNFFAIETVVVVGNEHVDEERILELAGAVKGANIFSVDRQDAARYVEIEPRIKSAVIQRRLPSTLVITVEERQAVALLNSGRYMIEVDASGRVLDRYQVIDSADLPLISGVDLTGQGIVPGSIIQSNNLNAALTILASIPEDAVGIGEIHVADVQDIRLYTVDGVEVRLGDDSDFAEKYLIYSNILSSNEQENGAPIAYIDVSIPAVPAVSIQ